MTVIDIRSTALDNALRLQPIRQLIVVDAGLPRLDMLLTDLAPEQSVLMIEPHQDAVARISAALAHSPAESLAIVAHGRPGEVLIGQQGLDMQQLKDHASEISQWPVQEIQLYSCHTGAAVQFVETLEQLSGAVVFASEQTVGRETQGGSWLIESTAGAVSTVPFSVLGRSQWHFTLPAFAVEVATGSDLPPLPPGFDSYAVTIPDGTTVIEDLAFEVRPVSSVTIPDSVTSIGILAFSSTPLTSVTIGNGGFRGPRETLQFTSPMGNGGAQNLKVFQNAGFRGSVQS